MAFQQLLISLYSAKEKGLHDLHHDFFNLINNCGRI